MDLCCGIIHYFDPSSTVAAVGTDYEKNAFYYNFFIVAVIVFLMK